MHLWSGARRVVKKYGVKMKNHLFVGSLSGRRMKLRAWAEGREMKRFGSPGVRRSGESIHPELSGSPRWKQRKNAKGIQPSENRKEHKKWQKHAHFRKVASSWRTTQKFDDWFYQNFHCGLLYIFFLSVCCLFNFQQLGEQDNTGPQNSMKAILLTEKQFGAKRMYWYHQLAQRPCRVSFSSHGVTDCLWQLTLESWMDSQWTLFNTFCKVHLPW